METTIIRRDIQNTRWIHFTHSGHPKRIESNIHCQGQQSRKTKFRKENRD